MDLRFSTSSCSSSAVISTGSKYTSLTKVPPMSIPNQGKAGEERGKRINAGANLKSQLLLHRYVTNGGRRADNSAAPCRTLERTV